VSKKTFIPNIIIQYILVGGIDFGRSPSRSESYPRPREPPPKRPLQRVSGLFVMTITTLRTRVGIGGQLRLSNSLFPDSIQGQITYIELIFW
jgi:hypothetical protein